MGHTQVKAAMNEINAAQRLRIAAVEQSEAEKIRVVKESAVLSGMAILAFVNLGNPADTSMSALLLPGCGGRRRVQVSTSTDMMHPAMLMRHAGFLLASHTCVFNLLTFVSQVPRRPGYRTSAPGHHIGAQGNNGLRVSRPRSKWLMESSA